MSVVARRGGGGDEAVDLSFGRDDVDEGGVAWRAGASLLLRSVEGGGASAREGGLGKSVVLLAVTACACEVETEEEGQSPPRR